MATEIKSDQIKSEKLVAIPSANKPTSPVEGMVFRADGSGDSAKGLYEYKNSKWVSLDNTFADMESIALLTSGDTSALQFAAALNSTSTAAGHKNAVPHETALGSISGTFTVPTAGSDALFTDRNANLVFRYASSGTASCKNEYVGITIDIPAAFRGQNLVAEFQYRTEESTTASSNNDFQLSVWDKTTGKSITSTDTSAKTAGQDIAVSSKVGLTVGDKIWLESGGNAVGDSANTITQSYITAISGTADTITISADWTPASTTGSVLVTKFLSDYDIGLPEADSDTNKDGSTYKLAFKTEADTAQVNLYWQNKSTTANSLELFFDGILVSANKFLQASSQTKSEYYKAYFQASFWDNSGDCREWDESLLVAGPGTPPLAESRFIQIDSTSRTNYDLIKARQRIKIDLSVGGYGTAGWWAPQIMDSNDNPLALQQDYQNDYAHNAAVSLILEKGDYVYVENRANSDLKGSLSIVATPQTSDVILLESQDQIFTDWTEFDTSLSTHSGTAPSGLVVSKGRWRRVGSSMDLTYTFTSTSTSTGGTGTYLINLPTGYSIDLNQIQGTVTGNTTNEHNPGLNGFGFFDDGSNHSWYKPIIYNSTQAYFIGGYHGGNNTAGAGGPTLSGDKGFMIGISGVPIAGWNSNFNPLMSLPLVNVGTDVEEIQAWGLVGSTAETPRGWTNVQKNTASDIISVANISTAMVVTAIQKCKISASYSQAWSTSSFIWIVKNGNQTTGVDTAANANAESAAGYTNGGEPQCVSAEFIMDPGDTLYVSAGTATGQNTDKYRSNISITATKDRGNTNMAHIIKPAVAYFSYQIASGSSGGGLTGGRAYDDITMNVFKGETWFISAYNGTLGVGGTNWQMTLEPGTYELSASQPVYQGNACFLRFRNQDDGIVLLQGEHQYTGASLDGQVSCTVRGTFTLTAAKACAFQIGAETAQAANGLGVSGTFSGVPETYLNGMIRKLK